jgi:hypothetical protein
VITTPAIKFSIIGRAAMPEITAEDPKTTDTKVAGIKFKKGITKKLTHKKLRKAIIIVSIIENRASILSTPPSLMDLLFGDTVVIGPMFLRFSRLSFRLFSTAFNCFLTKKNTIGPEQPIVIK